MLPMQDLRVCGRLLRPVGLRHTSSKGIGRYKPNLAWCTPVLSADRISLRQYNNIHFGKGDQPIDLTRESPGTYIRMLDATPFPYD